jgi:hypothetical protein
MAVLNLLIYPGAVPNSSLLADCQLLEGMSAARLNVAVDLD